MILRLAALVIALLETFAGSNVSAQDMNQIAAAYREHGKALSSILVEYEETSRSVVSNEMLFKYMGVAFHPTKHATVIVQGNKIYYDEESRLKQIGKALELIKEEDPKLLQSLTGDLTHAVPFSEIEKRLPRVSLETRSRTLMYDGSTLLEKSLSPSAGSAGKTQLRYQESCQRRALLSLTHVFGLRRNRSKIPAAGADSIGGKSGWARRTTHDCIIRPPCRTSGCKWHTVRVGSHTRPSRNGGTQTFSFNQDGLLLAEAPGNSGGRYRYVETD